MSRLTHSLQHVCRQKKMRNVVVGQAMHSKIIKTHPSASKTLAINSKVAISSKVVILSKAAILSSYLKGNRRKAGVY